jgi:hypothetical protein
MKTLEVQYTDMAKNTPRVPAGSNIFREVRTTVRGLNRNPRRTVNVRLVNKPGAIIEKDGQKYLITRHGKRLAI